MARTLLGIAEALSRELRPGAALRPRGLDASLDHDWGFDSLARAELFLRVERTFNATLPERLFGEAETLRDLVNALGPATKEKLPPQPDVPTRADAGAPAPLTLTTLTAVLDWHAEHHREHRHLLIQQDDERDVSLSYHDLANRAQAVALGLREAGVEPGDRVGIMLPTSEAFFYAFFGALYAGATPTPIYPPARLAQIGEHLQRQAGILANAGAVTLIADEVGAASRQAGADAG